MNNIVYLIPFITALFGWAISLFLFKLLFHPAKSFNFLGFTIQGILASKQLQIAKETGRLVSVYLQSCKTDIQTKATDKANIDKLLPFIDENVSHFLKVKLAEKMPVISMFIGDATTAELKAVFIEEVQVLFPELIKRYLDGMLSNLDIENFIAEKVAAIPISKIESAFNDAFSKQLNSFGLICGLVGFLVGTLQLLVVFATK